MTEERLSRVEREVAALQARTDSIEKRMERLQISVTEARNDAHRDSQQLQEALDRIGKRIEFYISKEDQAIGARSALKWAVGTILALLATAAALLALRI